MASAINSDNGVVSGSAGLKSSADSSGVLDLQTNGTTAISISASQVVTYTNQPTYTGGTANGVMYLNGSKAVTTGTALTFDGSQLDIPLGSAGAPSLSTPTDPNTGMFFPAADTIAFAEGGVEAMRLDASGNLNMTGGGTINTANTFGFKNRIINGAMVIDQRNAGALVAGATGNIFAVDRFPTGVFGSGTGRISAQQSSTVPTNAGFLKSVINTVTTADASPSQYFGYCFQHKIEGFNTADLEWGTASAKTVTLSFWVRSSLTGTYIVTFSNENNDRTYSATYTISAANTWEQKVITVAGDTTGTWYTTNNAGIQLFWGLGGGSGRQAPSTNAWNTGAAGGYAVTDAAGCVDWIATSGATFYITGVQLEKGSTATSFDYRPYGTELALCQRYYYTSSSTAIYMAGQSYSAGSIDGLRQSYGFPVVMRTTPTAAVSGGTDGGSVATLAVLYSFASGVALNLYSNDGNTSVWWQGATLTATAEL